MSHICQHQLGKAVAVGILLLKGRLRMCNAGKMLSVHEEAGPLRGSWGREKLIKMRQTSAA